MNKFELLRNFSIYRVNYAHYQQTINPIAFILFSGVGSKIHCIYLNAPGMDSFARMKFIGILKRLKDLKVPWNPRMMFRILKVYAPEVLRSGYRTLRKIYVNRIALINYGLNKEEDFSKEMLQESLKDRALFYSKNRETVSKVLDQLNRRGISVTKYNSIFAKTSS